MTTPTRRSGEFADRSVYRAKTRVYRAFNARFADSSEIRVEQQVLDEPVTDCDAWIEAYTFGPDLRCERCGFSVSLCDAECPTEDDETQGDED